MPEGDTILRTAVALRRVLVGRRIEACESSEPAVARAGLAGTSVADVEALGKNLLVHFDDGRALHTHMRMTGSWHIYRHGELWQRRPAAARVTLTTTEHVVVCFAAPVVRLLPAGRIARDAQLAGVGPDLLDPACDLTAARASLKRDEARPIGEAIMDQRLVAGIGNVHKSEALFVARLDPFAPVSDIDDAALDRLLLVARDALQRQVRDGGPRRTRLALAGPRVWVYRRSGRPCLACGAVVAMKRQGAAARSTYYCPRCQGIERVPAFSTSGRTE